MKNELIMTALMTHAFGGGVGESRQTLQIDPQPKEKTIREKSKADRKRTRKTSQRKKKRGY